MGEKSRRIGELGEDVVKNIISLAGWISQSNIELPCHYNDRHLNNKGEAKKHHGIDFIVHYPCPLEVETQETLLISAKYYKEYPDSPQSMFKSFLKDVSEGLECLKVDPNYGLFRVNGYIRNVNYTGVIFWLGHDEPDDVSIIDKITEFRNTEGLNFDSIFLVDGWRANFLLKSIQFIKTNYSSAEYLYYYPDTGRSTHAVSGRKHSGKLLPVQYINSSVLPFKLTFPDKREYLLLTVIEEFSEMGLKRMIGLAQNLTQSWGNEIIIAFPNYHQLKHENIVSSVKSLFSDSDLMNKIVVKSMEFNFKSLEEG